MYRRHSRDKSYDVFLSELAVAVSGGSNPQALPSPDGQYIAFPASREDRSDLWLLDERGNESRLTAGCLVTSPYPRYHVDAGWMNWHPTESSLAYISTIAGSADLWIADVETGEKARVTRHSEPDGDPSFSPDGSELAFVTDHWTQNGLAVAGVDGERLQALRRDEYSYADPRWLDLETLLAVRTPRFDAYDYETELVRISRDGELDVAFGREGVKAYAPRPRPDTDDFAFIQDSSGYDALSFQRADGSVETLFEPNMAVVGAPTWNDQGTKLAVTVTANCESQVWIVSIDGSTDQVSSVRGLHSMPAWRGDDVISVLTTPTVPLAVQGVTADEALTQFSAVGFDRRLVEPERMTYRSTGDVKIQAMVYLPPSGSDIPDSVPVLVNPHQGPTLFDGFGFDYPPQYFAALGYAVVQPNYRGSAGFGREFRNRNDRAWGVDDLDDVVNAADAVAEKYPIVDGDRAGIFGSSLGGVMTVNALGKSNRFEAGAAFSGIYDYVRFIDDTADAGTRLLTREFGPPAENIETYRKLSPVRVAKDIDVPILVLHGEEDEMVNVNQSELLVESLAAYEKEYEYHPYPEEGHAFTRREAVVDAYTRVADFFEKYL